MSQLILKPIRRIEGQVQLPGSKSLSNRILLLSALARGTTQVRNLLDSDDTRHMVAALQHLRVSLSLSEDKTQGEVVGVGGPFPSQRAELFLGNAGTVVRPLCAALCLGQGEFTLTGEPRMYERPIKDLVDALRQLGANIQYLNAEGYLPLSIHATGLKGGPVKIRGNISSQYLTALLLISPLARQEMVIKVEGELVSKPYIDMTIDVMRRFGVTVEADGYAAFRVPAERGYQSPGSVLVEGDASSATYFLAAAAIRGGTVRANGVGGDSVQGDVRLADVLEKMGAVVRRGQDWIEVSHGELHGVDLDLNHMPDAAMTVATTALFARGKTVIRNVYNWRVKETDRLAAMATELRKVGAQVDEGRDYLEITPPESIRSAAIDTYNDHRMAMCFSLAALGDAEITINNPECVSKTFPEYFEQLRTISLA
ncbi:MAG TPA: 3-phosphoshikimate 1-carboxyvinyltransferase [Dehalococcoidia bacterium]|nr:3-phosphoshikimate 1-carboxyvinyltransferase [Dehalococcoidia bacterium]